MKRKRNLRIWMALVVFCSLAGLLFLHFLLTPDHLQIKIISGEFEQLGDLDYRAKLKHNLIYERDEINREKVLYSALLEEMTLIYRYIPNPAKNISGECLITIKLSPLKGNWEREISKFESKINSSLEIQIPLDWSRIISEWRQIEKETEYDFGEPNVKFSAHIRISDPFGKEQEFNHVANITYGKVITISGAIKEAREKYQTTTAVKNKIDLFGAILDVQTLKMSFGAIFFLLLLPTSLLTLKERRNLSEYFRERKRRVFERRFRNKIVSLAEELDFKNPIRVDSLKDLGKISYELEKPILKSGGKYAVIDNENLKSRTVLKEQT